MEYIQKIKKLSEKVGFTKEQVLLIMALCASYTSIDRDKTIDDLYKELIK